MHSRYKKHPRLYAGKLLFKNIQNTIIFINNLKLQKKNKKKSNIYQNNKINNR